MRVAVLSSSAVRRRAAALVLTCLAAGAARADTVLLHNGDRLTGRILHMSPGTLTFETTWAGEMSIPRYEIRSIETDKPVPVLRERADRPESVSLKPVGPGRVLLTPEAKAVASPPQAPDAAPVLPGQAGAQQAAGPAQPAVEVPIARLRYIYPKPEESGEGASYAGRATLSGAFARGDTHSDRLYAEGDFTARAMDWRYALTGKLLQERDLDGTTASNWSLSGNHDRFIDDEDKSFVYLRASAEHDRFNDVTSRLALGAGYGRQLLQSERTTISVRGGLEAITLRRADGRRDSSPALGWGLNVSHRVGLLSAELFHDQRGYHSLDDTSMLTLRSRTGLRMPLASGLTASLQVNLDRDGEHVPGHSVTDTTWLIGLGYAW